jgi:deoxyribodipyrimidine photolyase
MQQLVSDSYKLVYKFEVTQVFKRRPEDNHAWIISTLPEQRDKTMKHKVAINGELIRPTANNSEKLIEAELAKKNCLMFIAMNLNIHKNMEEVEEAIKELFGAKNIANFYFPRHRDNSYNGIVNVECQFPTTYKQYVKKTIKLPNKYVKFTPHPCCMDGTNVLDEATMRKLDFLDVNTALANTVQAIQNKQQQEGRIL